MSYILFAEDDPACLELIQETLEAQGYLVHTATTGSEALTLALQEKPQLMLLDVMMPGKTGLEVTAAVKSHYRDSSPYTILITALGSWQDIEKGRLAGADDYIIKPFSPEALTEKVRAVMQR